MYSLILLGGFFCDKSIICFVCMYSLILLGGFLVTKVVFLSSFFGEKSSIFEQLILFL
jgi:hypothetical protein